MAYAHGALESADALLRQERALFFVCLEEHIVVRKFEILPFYSRQRISPFRLGRINGIHHDIPRSVDQVQ